jgi:hypothetical protein
VRTGERPAYHNGLPAFPPEGCGRAPGTSLPMEHTPQPRCLPVTLASRQRSRGRAVPARASSTVAATAYRDRRTPGVTRREQGGRQGAPAPILSPSRVPLRRTRRGGHGGHRHGGHAPWACGAAPGRGATPTRRIPGAVRGEESYGPRDADAASGGDDCGRRFPLPGIVKLMKNRSQTPFP